MKKYVVEFIGTFFLILSIFLSVLGEMGNLAPLAIGATLIAMIYAGGHISRAHYNPAVSIAFLIHKEMDRKDLLPYWIAQLLAAVMAWSIGLIFLPEVHTSPTERNLLPIFCAEFLGTFALVFVIMNVAIAKGTEGNGFYAVAIGLIVIGGAYIFGPSSGAAFNPAVSFATSIMGMSSWYNLGLFLLAQFAGSIAAAYVCMFLSKD